MSCPRQLENEIAKTTNADLSPADLIRETQKKCDAIFNIDLTLNLLKRKTSSKIDLKTQFDFPEEG